MVKPGRKQQAKKPPEFMELTEKSTRGLPLFRHALIKQKRAQLSSLSKRLADAEKNRAAEEAKLRRQRRFSEIPEVGAEIQGLRGEIAKLRKEIRELQS